MQEVGTFGGFCPVDVEVQQLAQSAGTGSPSNSAPIREQQADWNGLNMQHQAGGRDTTRVAIIARLVKSCRMSRYSPLPPYYATSLAKVQ